MGDLAHLARILFGGPSCFQTNGVGVGLCGLCFMVSCRVSHSLMGFLYIINMNIFHARLHDLMIMHDYNLLGIPENYQIKIQFLPEPFLVLALSHL